MDLVLCVYLVNATPYTLDEHKQKRSLDDNENKVSYSPNLHFSRFSSSWALKLYGKDQSGRGLFLASISLTVQPTNFMHIDKNLLYKILNKTLCLVQTAISSDL